MSNSRYRVHLQEKPAHDAASKPTYGGSSEGDMVSRLDTDGFAQLIFAFGLMCHLPRALLTSKLEPYSTQATSIDLWTVDVAVHWSMLLLILNILF